ncbi:hypothetical protein NCS52_00134600 [Fusarium sp. LHS14.1]|nr:hypothetical protein NCS52_00134600 [Fusarium sp. LHS14.1]
MPDPPNQEAPKMGNQELGVWLKGPEQKIEPESRKNGFSILPERVHDDFSDDAKDGREVRANFSNIPLNKATLDDKSPKEAVKAALEHFQAHTHMGQVLKRRTPYFSVADVVEPEKEKTVYTAIFDTGTKDFKTNLAFTSTYFHSHRTSFGIILGCTEEDIKNATTLLRECRRSHNHQLRLPAVFFELQQQRLAGIRKEHTTKALQLQANFEDVRDYKNGQKPFEFGYRPWSITDCTKALTELCTDSNVMAEEIKIALRQLNKLKRHAKGLAEREREPKETPDAKTKKLTWDNTHCFIDLFDEISDDLELVSGAVAVNAQTATTTADEMIRSISKQDTRWSMGFAGVSMAYLPITALAKIFALPVFDFKANWRGTDNQPANWSESSGGDTAASASPSSPPPLPVTSIYFTYWISTSIALTWFTIEVWWILSSETEHWRWDRIWLLRLLAGAIELIIELPSWVFNKFSGIRTWVSEKVGEIWTWVFTWVVKCRSFLEDHREKRRKSESTNGVSGESSGGVQSGQMGPV